MTKYILILGLLSVVGWLIYRRLRPYIQTLRRVFTTMRDVRATLVKQQEARGASQISHQPERLERCGTCGVWLPASRALMSRTSLAAVYCSRDCLDQSLAKSAQSQSAATNT